MNGTRKACVLLFSGGRDSTLAAIRLSAVVEKLILLTVTSEHLIGIDVVRKRLVELKRYLPGDTRWINMVQPAAMPSDRLFQAATCLPCHRSYTALGIIAATRFNAECLAFGYTRYQSDWLEQTPQSIECLTRVLASHGMNLLLPVSDIATKHDAILELEKYSLSTVALEQKCLQQQFNTTLKPSEIENEIAAWEKALTEALRGLSGLKPEILADIIIGDLTN
jgi:hypothetical protein